MRWPRWDFLREEFWDISKKRGVAFAKRANTSLVRNWRKEEFGSIVINGSIYDIAAITINLNNALDFSVYSIRIYSANAPICMISAL